MHWRAIPCLACALVVGCCAMAAGEPPTFALRYRFEAGATLTYETRTSAVGRIAVREGREEKQPPLPIGLDAMDRTTYTVKSVAADGTAVIEARLVALTLTSTIPGQGSLEVNRRKDDVVVRANGQELPHLPLPSAGKPTPPDVITAFGGWDPLKLLAPTQLGVTPAGLVTVQAGTSWVKTLVQMPTFGQLAPYFQPFGPAFLELPGRALELGKEWDQTRQLPLPGLPAPGGEASYPLDVLFCIDAKQTMGKQETAKIGFEGAATVQDKPIRLLVGGSAMALTLETLTHHLRGTVNFDAEKGRLFEQHLRSELTSVCLGGPNHEFTIDFAVTVEAGMVLVPD